MPRIYVLISRSGSIPSRLIYLATRDPYTHSSLSFSDSLEVMYSFARKYSASPIPAGLVTERLDGDFFVRNAYMPCALYGIDVSDEVYSRAKEICKKMLSRADEYHYNFLGICTCNFNIAYEREKHYFCSQFVAKVLSESGAVKFSKPLSLIHPYDFPHQKGFKLIFEGKLCELTMALRGVSYARTK